jgi:uncharacterized coiled-coil DUF342 family protein
MKKTFGSVLCACAALMIMSGCKPTTKNEMQYWDNNKKEYAEAVAKYSVFKPYLLAKKNEAEKIWQDALKITAEEEKAKKMKEANEKIDELLNQFTQIKYKSQSLEEGIDSLSNKKLTKEENRIRVEAIDDAYRNIHEVAESMRTAKVASENEVKKLTGDLISKLITAQGNFDRKVTAIKKIQGKK